MAERKTSLTDQEWDNIGSMINRAATAAELDSSKKELKELDKKLHSSEDVLLGSKKNTSQSTLDLEKINDLNEKIAYKKQESRNLEHKLSQL